MSDIVGEFERCWVRRLLNFGPIYHEMCSSYFSKRRFPSIQPFETV